MEFVKKYFISLPIDELHKLPEMSGVYVIGNDHDAYYVGQTENLKNRCSTLSKHHALGSIPDKAKYSFFFRYYPPEKLLSEEKKLILNLNPLKNRNAQATHTEHIGFKLSFEDKQKIRKLAKEKGIGVSTFVRELVLENI